MRVWIFATVALMACSSSSSDGGGGAGTDGGSDAAGDSGGTLSLHCETDPRLCTCVVVASNPDPAPSCTTTSFTPGTICCAGSGYPETTGSICQCQPWGCSETSGTCSCSSSESGATATACTKSWSNCCLNTANGLCQCFNVGSCNSGEIKVTQCGIDVATCLATQTRIDRCTL